MLIVNDIRNNKKTVIDGLLKRNIKDPLLLLDQVLDLDDRRKRTQSELDSNLAESNALAKQIGILIKEGRRDEANLAKSRSVKNKQVIKTLGEELNNIQNKLRDSLYDIPNIPNAKVPDGNSEEENEVIYQSGKEPELTEGSLPHWDLIKKYDIIDFELGNKITGAGFPVYKGKGARLQRALVNFFLDEAVKEGYAEVQPPIIVNEDSGYATGQLPDKEGQMYRIEAENFFLIPTAEVPITNIYRDSVLTTKDLPIKIVGYSPCFRREAGSWGSHVRGLNRLHQFDKVEIVRIEHPDNSYEALDNMCKHVQGLLEKLELYFRMIILCGGDLGFTSTITYDFEVFSGAQKKWLEVSSVSNFETYQANRLKLRYKGEDKRPQFLHTLNGSALALPRIIAALLENNQTEEGINLPKVLHPYTGFTTIF